VIHLGGRSGSAGAFVHRYGKVASWNAAGRPVFVVLAVFFLQRSLRRRYLSWKESSRLPLMAAAAVTVQATVRAMAAQRELSVRKQTRAATRIQVLAYYSDQSTVAALYYVAADTSNGF
jgi:hypothetical protein